MMEEQKQKTNNFDSSLLSRQLHSNMPTQNNYISHVENEVIITTTKDEKIMSEDGMFIKQEVEESDDDMDVNRIVKNNGTKFIGERRLNVSVSVGGSFGKRGGMRTVVLHVPEDIQ